MVGETQSEQGQRKPIRKEFASSSAHQPEDFPQCRNYLKSAVTR